MTLREQVTALMAQMQDQAKKMDMLLKYHNLPVTENDQLQQEFDEAMDREIRGNTKPMTAFLKVEKNRTWLFNR
jgi:hypothetical protein